MPPRSHLTSTDNYQLLLAIIKQISTKGVNWNQIAADIGMEKADSAKMRWIRFKKANGMDDGGATKEPKVKVQKVTKATNGKGRDKRKKVAKVESDDVNGGYDIMEGEEYEVKAEMRGSAGSGSSSDGEGAKAKMEPSGDEQDHDEAMQSLYGEERGFEDLEGDLWVDANEEIVA
jgi:hypothetical protein